jgi:alpha-tubulin suppressor-like RCC1 family protein
MGQLGLEGAGAPVPAQVGRVSDWLTVSAGRRHVCALRTLGLVYCWGDDAEGQLGPGDLVDRRQPEEVCVGDGIE